MYTGGIFIYFAICADGGWEREGVQIQNQEMFVFFVHLIKIELLYVAIRCIFVSKRMTLLGFSNIIRNDLSKFCLYGYVDNVFTSADKDNEDSLLSPCMSKHNSRTPYSHVPRRLCPFSIHLVLDIRNNLQQAIH